MVKAPLTFASIIMGALFTASSTCAAEANGKGFVFGGDKVRSIQHPDQELKLGNVTSVFDLKSTLQDYEIVLSLECSGYCFIVQQNGEALLEVYYDEERRVIGRIVSYSPYARDDRGNKVGDLLARAVGVQPFDCDAGESIFCTSKSSRGVSYSVGGTEGCGVKQKTGTDKYIAAPCAKIEAVAISRK